jgi:toxin-antitoxin system PIN domain toxin
MIIVDTNLLIYAYNRDAPWHAATASWLEALFSSEEIVGLPDLVLVGFIRIVTQPRIVPQPISPAQAVALVESWLALPNVRLLLGTPESFRRSLDALREAGVAGNLCTDAQIAALATIYRATVATVDTDFQRFAGLKLLNPLKH